MADDSRWLRGAHRRRLQRRDLQLPRAAGSPARGGRDVHVSESDTEVLLAAYDALGRSQSSITSTGMFAFGAVGCGTRTDCCWRATGSASSRSTTIAARAISCSRPKCARLLASGLGAAGAGHGQSVALPRLSDRADAGDAVARRPAARAGPRDGSTRRRPDGVATVLVAVAVWRRRAGGSGHSVCGDGQGRSVAAGRRVLAPGQRCAGRRLSRPAASIPAPSCPCCTPSACGRGRSRSGWPTTMRPTSPPTRAAWRKRSAPTTRRFACTRRIFWQCCRVCSRPSIIRAAMASTPTSCRRRSHDQGLKVALSGLGGDEIFGGYPSFRRLRARIAGGAPVEPGAAGTAPGGGRPRAQGRRRPRGDRQGGGRARRPTARSPRCGR